jgi:hypothetical protein
MENKKSIFNKRVNILPYDYPSLLQYKDAIRHSYWIDTEFNFTTDINDFKVNITTNEKEVIKRTMLSIAQIEVNVKTFWADMYKRMPITEIGDVGMTFAECHGEGTEILTPKGWVNFKDIDTNTEVIQYDINTYIQQQLNTIILTISNEQFTQLLSKFIFSGSNFNKNINDLINQDTKLYLFGISDIVPNINTKTYGNISSKLRSEIPKLLNDTIDINDRIVFQNILEEFPDMKESVEKIAAMRLEKLELNVLTHSIVPTNDGGLSLGQAVIAAAKYLKEIT